MNRQRKMSTWLISMSLLIVCIIAVFQFLIWKFTSKDVIEPKIQQLLNEVNYQYARQLDDRILVAKKIADGIKSDESIKKDILNLNYSRSNFYTTQSNLAMKVMKQLNTMSVNTNIMSGVRILLKDGDSIQCYRSPSSRTTGIEERWFEKLEAEMFDYKWYYDATNDKRYMLTYIVDGLEPIAILEMELIDDLFSEVVADQASDLDMVVSITDKNGFNYYNNSEDTNEQQIKEQIEAESVFNTGQWILSSALPKSYLNQEMHRFSILFIQFSILLMLSMVLLLAINSYSVIKPLQKLVVGLRNVQRRNWDFRLEEMYWAEFDLVNKTFNEMTETIQNYLDKIENQNQRLYELEKMAYASRFNPHFVFNTLDMIRWELELANRPKLGEIIVKFSSLLRYSVSTGREIVSVQSDFSYIQQYLEINQSLFGERLKYQIKMDAEVQEMLIPRLLIQPLIENALKYAFDNWQQDCCIVVNAYVKGKGLEIEVSDNGSGMQSEFMEKINWGFENWKADGGEMIRKEGLGLYLVSSMAKYYYGAGASMHLEKNGERGLRVCLTLAGLCD